MPIKPTRPTARASLTPRSRAAAETWANGMNIGTAPSSVAAYIQRKRGCAMAWRKVRPGTTAPARTVAAGARRSSAVAARPSTRVAAASHCKALRQLMLLSAQLSSSGTTSVPAPMPELATPAARPRRRVNHGCTQAMAGV